MTVAKSPAFYTTAVSSVTNRERLVTDGPDAAATTRPYSTFDLIASSDNEHMIEIAKDFLRTACPELLEQLESPSADEKSAADRLVKIGRNINATLRYAEEVAERRRRGETSDGALTAEEEGCLVDGADREQKTEQSLQRLVKECSGLAGVLEAETQGKELSDAEHQVPKVRYGRTELQMPIVTLGCMRFQQSWNRGGPPVTKKEQIVDECQDNLVRILKHAIRSGINHIETAEMYGCSEMQIGMALRKLFDEGFCKREDLIIQTKGGITSGTTKAAYKESIDKQIERLGVGYVDLFSCHGLNTMDHYNWMFDNGDKGNLIDAVRELREEGKIHFIGFSTHAPVHVIRKAIESDAFDYLNLHYHFFGSYTASGDGGHDFEGNADNVRLAKKHDMGVFVISPYDKGGRLFAPSNLLRDITLPDMEPMEFNSLWIWDQERLAQQSVHTITVGAARPSDLDQPILAAIRSRTDGAADDLDNVVRRLHERQERALGKEWMSTWQVGLPNYYQSQKNGAQIGNIVWMYNCIRAFGLLDFAKERYGACTGNLKNWNYEKTWEENVFASPGFNWMPGCAYDPSLDYEEELADVPAEQVKRVREAIEFVHEWCGSASNVSVKDEKKEEEPKKNEIPLEWQIAYDMRPWTAFPERG